MITNFTHSQIVLIASFYTLITLSGCAIHYRDAKTGAGHIWGFGHLATKATSPEDSKQAVITQSTLSGINLSIEGCKVNERWVGIAVTALKFMTPTRLFQLSGPITKMISFYL